MADEFYDVNGTAYRTVSREIENWPEWKRKAYEQNFKLVYLMMPYFKESENPA